MTLSLELTPDLEERLSKEAHRRGLAVAEHAVQLLSQCLPPHDRHTELAALLKSWIDESDTTEQKAAGDELIRALDEDRLSKRRLFPPELEGVTW
jgi:hypothetical protein